MENKKQSGAGITSEAARAMSNKNNSEINRSLAASIVAQRNTSKQTSAELESVASKVLNSDKYSDQTKSFAASVLSQSNKKR